MIYSTPLEQLSTARCTTRLDVRMFIIIGIFSYLISGLRQNGGSIVPSILKNMRTAWSKIEKWKMKQKWGLAGGKIGGKIVHHYAFTTDLQCKILVSENSNFYICPMEISSVQNFVSKNFVWEFVVSTQHQTVMQTLLQSILKSKMQYLMVTSCC